MAGDVLPDWAIAKAAHAAGFRGAAAVTAVAIALAESGGRPRAHNRTPPDDSYGLMQINYYGNLRAGRTAAYGPPEGLFDPEKNMRAAFAISSGGKNFTPWTTYTSGAYLLHKNRASVAVGSTDGNNSAGDVLGDLKPDLGDLNPLTGIPNPLKGIEAVGAFFATLLDPSTWRRVLLVLGGALVVGVGLALIFRDALADGAAAAATGGLVTDVPTP
jgi:hypothetical protein